MNAYEAVMGLEIHAQLMTQSKAFCPVANSFGLAENEMVGPVSGGQPGALPVLNIEAIRLAVRAGLALNCSINPRSIFARKNYFYPDLPKGYQISQFDAPICGQGYLDILVEGKGSKRVGIERIHIEEDAGKLTHLSSFSLVNLNRAGVPLIEIVSKPDLRSASEAAAYMRKLHAILVYANVCDGNLEEGNFRCDVNVSVRPVGTKTLGTRTELKNINSFRFVEKAAEYEIARQIAVIEAGGTIVQETRGWDAAVGKTFSMRKKEEAHDYRYFPEPDLPPLVFDQAFIQEVKALMPELPDQKRQRFMDRFHLSEVDAEALTSSKDIAEYFENCVALGAAPKPAANWILSELLRVLKENDLEISKSPLTPVQLCALIGLIEKGAISGKIAKGVFEELYLSGGDPKEIVERKGLLQVLDPGQIDAWVSEVIAAHPAVVADYKAGKTKALGFMVGEVMKLSKGKANPPAVNEAFKQALARSGEVANRD